MISGEINVHNTFKKYFGIEKSEISFSTTEVPNTLLINGKGLFVSDFNLTFKGISFTFLGKNKEVVRCNNGSLKIIEDSNTKDHLEFIYNNKAAHLSSTYKLWKFNN